MLDDGLNWLQGQLQTHAGTRLRIRRGDCTSDPLNGVKTKHQADSDEAGPLQVSSRRYDWLIAPADYQLAGSTTAPADDDRLDELDANDNVLATYQVNAETPGEPPWRYSDSQHTFFRTHTTLITTDG